MNICWQDYRFSKNIRKRYLQLFLMFFNLEGFSYIGCMEKITGISSAFFLYFPALFRWKVFVLKKILVCNTTAIN